MSSAGEPVARLPLRTSHLVIVSRGHAAMFDRLWARFSDSPGLQVIFDRRKTRRSRWTPERRASSESAETRLWTEGFFVVPIQH